MTLGVNVAAPQELTAPMPAQPTAADVLTFMQTRRSGNTQRAYQGDLRLFFAWRGQEVTPAALEQLCAMKAGELALVLNTFALVMRQSGFAPATTNRRLAAVRSLMREARKYGLTETAVDGLVDNEKARRYRDTSGPTLTEVQHLLAEPDRKTLDGKRDFALLTLLFENALRRAEVAGCNIEDFDAKRRRLMITGKGHAGEPEPITLSEHCAAAIAEYVDERSLSGRLDNGEPLFVNFSRSKPGRLQGNGLYKILRAYGLHVLDRALSPHKMRHAAATAVLDATDGDLRTAQALTRHADIRTLLLYDDNREDRQGKASDVLSGLTRQSP